MIGLVLSGGKSIRMGRDKGLLCSQAKSWVEIAKEKIESVELETWVSINSTQYVPYSKMIPVSNLISDNKELSVKGPLLGMLSAHILFPQEDILVLACDMPKMNVFLLKCLLENAKSGNARQAVVFRIGAELQPLCAIYSSSALRSALSMVVSGKLRSFSIKSLLPEFNVLEVECDYNQFEAFRNFNNLSDFINH